MRKMIRGRGRRGFGRMFCAICAMMAVGLCAFAQETDIPELLEPVGVKTDTAVAYIGDISDIALYEAAVVPYVEGVAFPVAGTVDQVHVIVGQSVRAGDVLITLDQTAQQEKAEEIRRNIERTETNGHYSDQIAAVDRSILELELEMLMTGSPDDSAAIAMKQMDIEQFDLEQELERELRELEISRLRESLAAIEEQMGQNVITAPFDGNVIFVGDIGKGSYVNAFASLVYIADDARMRVETGYIMDSILNNADRIYARIGGNTYDLEPIPMDQKDIFAKTLAGETITTAFEISDACTDVKVGDYAAVYLQSGVEENVLLIPRNALYIESGSRYVYVMEGDARIRRDVEIGRMTQHLVEIEAGLGEGDVVYVQE